LFEFSVRKTRPSGLAPPKKCCAIAWLTIATNGAPCVSCVVKSRPASSGVPSVVKNSGETRLNHATPSSGDLE